MPVAAEGSFHCWRLGSGLKLTEHYVKNVQRAALVLIVCGGLERASRWGSFSFQNMLEEFTFTFYLELRFHGGFWVQEVPAALFRFQNMTSKSEGCAVLK